MAPGSSDEHSTPRHNPEHREINDFLADTGVWISGGVILALVLWLVITELWH